MTEIILKTNKVNPEPELFQAGDWFVDHTTDELYSLVKRWDQKENSFIWALVNFIEGHIYAFTSARTALDAFGGDFNDFTPVKKAEVSIEL